MESKFRRGSLDPFGVAESCGLKLVYRNLPDSAIGLYTYLPNISTSIVINQSILPEEQEDACVFLVSHHFTHTHKPMLLDRETFEHLSASYRRSAIKNIRTNLSNFIMPKTIFEC